ncbi:5'-3' exonuclease [Umezawaea beigongshangensis]|uniref:5'-3' exonuclease n=1 Tax=Umezawaea beigongshangensis TaxID=2780383 RepID=UPI0018F2017B|nr:5'-3' exonuclease [Umezawaea beigongshangensis]
MSAPLVLLDSASLYFRSFYALPESMTAPDGTPVNAVRGFVDTVARVITERRAGRLVACLDADWRPEFRVAALPSYKAQRVAQDAGDGSEQVPDTLTPQVPIILDVLDAVGIATAEASGYEADDVIGALAARETRDPVEVVTGDRDMFQVVRDEPSTVRVIYVGRGWNKAEVLGPAELAEKYALPVANAGSAYADMAVLRGDPSDGLPGVAGIGEKTAAKLISEFGSLGALLAAVHDGMDRKLTTRARNALIAGADYLAVAPAVVRVAVDAPVVLDRPDAVPARPADPDRLAELTRRWGLGSSVPRLVSALERR